MTERPRKPSGDIGGDPRDGSGAAASRGTTTHAGTPRWVKVVGLIVAALVLLVIVMLLLGGHTPRRHGPSAAGVHAALAGVTQHRTASGGSLGRTLGGYLGDDAASEGGRR